MRKEIDNSYRISKIWETTLKPTLEHFFKITLHQTNRFHLFDYISDNQEIYIELKTRECTHLKYKDTMIGMNKIYKAIELITEGKKIYFVFKFTDGIYYWNYKGTHKNEWVRDGGRNDRSINEWKTKGYLYIPYNLLIKI
jgi:hypothetical protein